MSTARSTALYDLKQRCYYRHAARWRTIRLHAFPETGGVGLYIHNWIACSGSPDRDVAQIVANSGEWASWHRIEARIDRWMAQVEHRRHTLTFRPQWCIFCN